MRKDLWDCGGGGVSGESGMGGGGGWASLTGIVRVVGMLLVVGAVEWVVAVLAEFVWEVLARLGRSVIT